jgi:beta-N-acetylhexosaminidase
MVAHLIFSRIDPERPASVSPDVCALIRNDLGCDGVLITDCLTMEALKGTGAERVAASLEAGYDIALYTQGGLSAAEGAAKGAGPLSEKSLERIRRADHKRGSLRADVASLHAEVEEIFAQNGIA